MVLQQRLAETVHGAQRRPQIVRDGVGKALQFGIGGAQFGGALHDAQFKLGVEATNLLFCPPPLGDVTGQPEVEPLTAHDTGTDADLDREHRTVLAPMAPIDAQRPPQRQFPAEPLRRFGVEVLFDVEEIQLQQFLATVAEALASQPIDIEKASLLIMNVEGVRRLLDQGPEAGLAFEMLRTVALRQTDQRQYQHRGQKNVGPSLPGLVSGELIRVAAQRGNEPVAVEDPQHPRQTIQAGEQQRSGTDRQTRHEAWLALICHDRERGDTCNPDRFDHYALRRCRQSAREIPLSRRHRPHFRQVAEAPACRIFMIDDAIGAARDGRGRPSRAERARSSGSRRTP